MTKELLLALQRLASKRGYKSPYFIYRERELPWWV